MKNIYELGQEVPVSCVLKITGISSTKNGSYVYNTDKSLSISENILERIEMKPCEKTLAEEPVVSQQEDKPKFKAGDKAKIIANTSNHGFDIGEIIIVSSNLRLLSDGYCWKCTDKNGISHYNPNISERDLEPYTEPEPVKLYCVKDDTDWLTQGKIYEYVIGRGITYDNGFNSNIADNFEGWKRCNKSLSDCLVPLVKRPAKADEWVYIADAWDSDDCYKDGDILKVVETTPGVYVKTRKTHACCKYGKHLGCSYLSNREYLVLDGYKPEPEYLNGEVVCYESTGMYHTVGKVYEAKDGYINDDTGGTPFNDEPFKTLEEFNYGNPDKFIPYKGKSDADK